MIMSQKILLAITGGIAAYKSCELVRLLKKQGHDVTVAMSQSATEFIAPQTFQALSGNPVLTAQGGNGNGMAHINATRSADIMLIAPATANTLAKIAHGRQHHYRNGSRAKHSACCCASHECGNVAQSC